MNAKEILYALRVNLSRGININEVLHAIVEHFGGSITGEPAESAFELFSFYNYLGLVEIQPRTEGFARPYDEQYWIPTSLGNRVIRYLAENEFNQKG